MTKLNHELKTSEKAEDTFEAIMFRDTPGAPLSYDEDDAFSVMLSPNNKTTPSPQQTKSHLTKRINSPMSRSVKKGGMLPQIDESGFSTSRSNSSAFPVLPPKVVVSLVIHEEATSQQEKKSDLDDISSHVKIEGTAHAQLVSSNAGENPPLQLKVYDPDYPDDDKFILNKNFVIEEETDLDGIGIKTLVVPKKVIGQIQIALWERTVVKRFMPVLLQSKVIRTGANRNRCMVAIQLRSNLHNKGSLKALTATVAVPPTVIGDSLEIKQGEGTFNDLKRVITWTLKELPVGKSLMFGFEIDILATFPPEEVPKFPILIRCRSTDDTISSVEVNLEKMQGHPATLVVKKYASFRLLHRLPS